MNKISAALPLGFVYTPEIAMPDGRIIAGPPVCNVIPQAAIDQIVGMLRGTTTTIASWYVGIFEGNYVPTSGFTSADLQTLAQECTAYTAASRPEWQSAYDGVALVDNIAARAEYLMTDDKTIYGAFLVSNDTKGGTSGLTRSIARFNTPQVVPAGATFRVAAGLMLIPTT